MESDETLQADSSMRSRLTLVSSLESKQKWNLSSRKKSEEELKFIFSKISNQNTVKQILLQWNYLPNILGLINGAPLKHLKSLTLGGNSIVSLERISRTDIPQLEQLWLWNNKLTTISSLRKLQTSSLRILDLSSNYLSSVDSLLQMKAPKLQQINIQKNRFSCIDSLAKLTFLKENFRVAISTNIKDLVDNKFISISKLELRQGNLVATYFFPRKQTMQYC